MLPAPSRQDSAELCRSQNGEFRCATNRPASGNGRCRGHWRRHRRLCFSLLPRPIRPRSDLIERSDAVASATTSVSAHAIRCQFAEPENIAQMSESLAIYEHFRDLIGDPSAQIDLIQNGYLFASTEEADPALPGSRRSATCTRRHRRRTTNRRRNSLSISVDGGGDRHRHFSERDGWIDSALAANHFLDASGAPIALERPSRRLIQASTESPASDQPRPHRDRHGGARGWTVQSRHQPRTATGRALATSPDRARPR